MSKSSLIFLIVVFFVVFVGFIYASSFTDTAQVDFNNGTYVNTSFNGTGVVLNGSNTSGTFTSRIFDAGANSSWNNLTWYGSQPNITGLIISDVLSDIWRSYDYGGNWTLIKDDYNGAEGQNGDVLGIDSNNNIYIIEGDQDVWRSTDGGIIFSKLVSNFNGGNGVVLGLAINSSGAIFSVDVSADVWVSVNQGNNWTLAKDDYNGGIGNSVDDMVIGSDNNLYIVDRQDFWISTNNGINWTLANDDLNGAGDSNDGLVVYVDFENNVYVVDGSEDVLRSNNSGTNFTKVNSSNFNGGSGNVFGLNSYLANASLSFEVRTCTVSNCSDGTWQSANISSIGLYGRYFQYRVYLSTPDSIKSPFLNNVSISYSLVNQAPDITLILPQNAASYPVNASVSLNYSVLDEDGNLDSCWYNLNDGSNVSLVGCSNASLNLSVGNHVLKIYSNDSFGLVSVSSVNFSVVNYAPDISLISPTNGSSYRVNETTYLNYSVLDVDGNLGSCWYNIDGGSNNTLLNCTNASLNTSLGSHTLSIYVNDTLGLSDFENVIFSVTNNPPNLSLINPQDGNTYGYNQSIELSFSVFDDDANLDSCWYNVGGSNISITNCQNTTFNVSGSGSYVLTVYANDSYGNYSSDNVSFNVQIGAPTITLYSPMDVYLNSGENIEFRYIPDDIDLDSCELWTNSSGNWSLISIESDPSNGSQNSFILNLSDGSYSWNVGCNDSIGNMAFNGNKTFVVDSTKPTVIITQPTGIKSSRLNIPLTYLVIDAYPSSCWYNIYRGLTQEVANTSISCSLGSSSFNVTVDADFIINFYSDDSAGNSNSTSSAFSISTSAPPSGGSGGGGGGGGSGGGGGIVTTAKKTYGLDVGTISPIVVSSGGIKKVLSWNIKNSGNSYLNDCRFKSQGNYSSWITKSETKGLASGEEYNFVFDVNIPEDAIKGKYLMSVLADCKEINKSYEFYVDIKGKQVDFKLTNVERIEGNKVSVSYVIKDLIEREQNVDLQFLIFDMDNKKEAEVKETKAISAGSEVEFETLIPVREDLQGELSLLINLNSETYSAFVQENIVLGAPVSGFSIFGDRKTRDNLLSLGLVLLFLVFAFFVVRKIRLNKSKRVFKKL